MEKQALEILQKYWGYRNFRPLQTEIIQAVLSGKDAIALLPTGGGKSLCYQVPGMILDGLVIVVTPLIALMKDQVQHLLDRDIPALAIHSGMSFREIDRELDNTVHGKYKFIYVSPERLQTELFIERFKRMKVAFLAVDEAHCISQWGYDFRPVYLKISNLKNFKPELKTLALTATAVPEVIQDIGQKLELKKPILFQKSFSRDNLVYVVLYAEDKLSKMTELLSNSKGSAIIYTRNRKRTRELADYFNKKGIPADYYHAGFEANERDEKQQKWMKNRFPLMVCTNAFGMGIDKPDVRLVMHYDMPDSPEAYFQEAGRAGRDGRKAYSFLFWSDSDINNMERQFEMSFPPPQEVIKVYIALCNYFQVAYGSGDGSEFSFDMNDFSRKYNLPQVLVHHSIKFLEKEGYFVWLDNGYVPAKINITATNTELYSYQISNSESADLIKQLLRSYPGIIEDYVNVDLNRIASQLGKTFTELENLLGRIAADGILDYLKATDLPRILFTSPRIHNNDVKLSKKVYGFLKSKARERLDAMISYVKRSDKCRSRLLLEYFGETDSSDCGNCDVCKHLNSFYISDADFKVFTDKLSQLPVKKSFELNEFYKSLGLPVNKKNKQIVRFALDNNYLRVSESGGIEVISS